MPKKPRSGPSPSSAAPGGGENGAVGGALVLGDEDAQTLAAIGGLGYLLLRHSQPIVAQQ